MKRTLFLIAFLQFAMLQGHPSNNDCVADFLAAGSTGTQNGISSSLGSLKVLFGIMGNAFNASASAIDAFPNDDSSYFNTHEVNGFSTGLGLATKLLLWMASQRLARPLPILLEIVDDASSIVYFLSALKAFAFLRCSDDNTVLEKFVEAFFNGFILYGKLGLQASAPIIKAVAQFFNYVSRSLPSDSDIQNAENFTKSLTLKSGYWVGLIFGVLTGQLLKFSVIGSATKMLPHQGFFMFFGMLTLLAEANVILLDKLLL